MNFDEVKKIKRYSGLTPFRNGHLVPKEWRENISKGIKGIKRSKLTKKRISENNVKFWLGKKRPPISEEQKRKSVETRRRNGSYYRGEKHPNWKGNKSEIERLRKSVEYQLWRKSVFERDNYTCIWCGDNRGGNLEADHIKPFALFPELRFAIDNGRTLCVECHKKTSTYAGKGVKRKYKQFDA